MNLKFISILVIIVSFGIPLFSQDSFSSDSNSGICHFKLSTFIDRNVYILADSNYDNIQVYLVNSSISFRRAEKSIRIHLPQFLDTVEESYIRIHVKQSNLSCPDHYLPLIFGKPDLKQDIHLMILRMKTKLKSDFTKDSILQSIPNESLKEKKEETSFLPKWLNIYADAYYALYNDSVGPHQFQKFTSISPLSNTVGLNTIQINLQFENSNFRSLAAFHFGDFSKTSWPDKFKWVMEAHLGFRIVNKLWLDAGLFRTHLGTEGLLPRENICSSLAIGTIYEPSCISGIRLNYLPDNQWNIQLYLLNRFNGFNENNNKKSLGTLITYTLNENGNLGYSNYIGDDTPSAADSISHFRIHQNLFYNYQFSKIKLQIGGDWCIQKNADLNHPDQSGNMFSGIFTSAYLFSNVTSIYSRYEFFNDSHGFMSSTFSDNKNKLTGYKLWGITIGLQYKPSEKTFIRLEARRLQMNEDQKIFLWNGNFNNVRSEIMLNSGIVF